jgi:integrase
VIALRNVLKLARDRGLIERLPDITRLKEKPPQRRPLLTTSDIACLLAAAKEVKNGTLFSFYIRFLAASGAREQEALAVAWSDVDFKKGTVTVGSGGISKNHRSRTIDFSQEIEALLQEMAASRPPDSVWLFPSPQRGNKDLHAKSLRETLRRIRSKAGLRWIGFHDFRHFFASRCVMSGIDFMTIASWLGHSDGGILVGKVYGHLEDTQKRAAAQKLVLFESIAE